MSVGEVLFHLVAGQVNILRRLFGRLYVSPKTGGQDFIPVSLGMDETLTRTLGPFRSIVRDLPESLYPLLRFITAHVQTSVAFSIRT
jgi:hypothetical protein